MKISKALISLIFIYSAIAKSGVTYAAGYSTYCGDLKNALTGGVPHPLAIFCSIASFFNVIAMGAGAIFVIMIFVGSIKLSMAQGDPKALEGAKTTITHAIVGFLLILGYYLVVQIIKGVLGINNSVLTDPLGFIADQFDMLFRIFGVY